MYSLELLIVSYNLLQRVESPWNHNFFILRFSLCWENACDTTEASRQVSKCPKHPMVGVLGYTSCVLDLVLRIYLFINLSSTMNPHFRIRNCSWVQSKKLYPLLLYIITILPNPKLLRCPTIHVAVLTGLGLIPGSICLQRWSRLHAAWTCSSHLGQD